VGGRGFSLGAQKKMNAGKKCKAKEKEGAGAGSRG